MTTATHARPAANALPGCLSNQQVRFFRDTGYLRFPQQLPHDDVQRARAAVLAEFDHAAEPARRDPTGRVIRVSRIVDRAPIFRELLSSPAIVAPLASLLGPNIVLVRTRHNHATRNGAHTKAARLHRDVLQWSRPIVTVVVYLDPASEQSGCTRVIPTSQLLPFVGTPNNGGTWMDQHHVFADLLDQAVAVAMPPGGILAIDGLAFHAAGTAPAEQPRVALTAAYRSVDELAAAELSDGNYQLVCGSGLYRGRLVSLLSSGGGDPTAAPGPQQPAASAHEAARTGQPVAGLVVLDELRGIAQQGLRYARDPHDQQRYQRLMEVVAGAYAKLTGLAAAEVSGRFTRELGYPTAKVGVDAAVFGGDGDTVLLVCRADSGSWALPGGWVDPHRKHQIGAMRILADGRDGGLVLAEPLSLARHYLAARVTFGSPGHCDRTGAAGYRLLPHIADLIVEAWAPTKPACLAEAVRGLVAAFADTAMARPSGQVAFRLAPAADAELLLGVLEEVIYRLEVDAVVPVGVQVEVTPGGGLAVRLEVVPVERAELVGAVPKAVTWHGLSLGREHGRWACRATVDV